MLCVKNENNMEARLNKNTKIEIPDEEYENIVSLAKQYMSEQGLTGDSILEAYVNGYIKALSL